MSMVRIVGNLHTINKNKIVIERGIQWNMEAKQAALRQTGEWPSALRVNFTIREVKKMDLHSNGLINPEILFFG